MGQTLQMYNKRQSLSKKNERGKIALRYQIFILFGMSQTVPVS